MERISCFARHLAGDTCFQDVQIKNSPTAATVLGRTTTALEPSLFDKDRLALRCVSLHEREAWLRYFVSVRPAAEEGDIECEVTSGSLPLFLRGGSFFRNGPGLFERNGIRIHMADGDGLMLRVDFGLDGRVMLKKRYLDTPEFLRECKEDRVIYRGSYGTVQVQETSLHKRLSRNVGNLEWKVTGNTNHLFWGGRLFALHEVGLPIELDPNSLVVIDPKCTLNGILTSADAFSAHHRFDRSRRTVLNYGLNYKDPRGPILKFWEFDETFKLVSRCSLNLSDFKLKTIVHSFAATNRYFIQLCAPCHGGFKYFLGWGVDDSIYHDFEADCAYLCVVDRFQVDRNEATWYKCVNWWPNHHVGAFETASGDIILDSVMYEKKTVGWIEREPFDLPRTRVVRFHIPHSQYCKRKGGPLSSAPWVAHEVVYNRDCEMPVVNPQTELLERRYLWLVDMSASKMANKHADMRGFSHRYGEALDDMPWTGVIKVDLKNGSAQTYHPGAFCGEVVFVPNPAPDAEEDDGVLLSLNFDPVSMKSDLVVLDAKDITKGCIARIALKGHIPFSFHCGWEQNYLSRLKQ